jgi:hypothetical protein
VTSPASRTVRWQRQTPSPVYLGGHSPPLGFLGFRPTRHSGKGLACDISIVPVGSRTTLYSKRFHQFSEPARVVHNERSIIHRNRLRYAQGLCITGLSSLYSWIANLTLPIILQPGRSDEPGTPIGPRFHASSPRRYPYRRTGKHRAPCEHCRADSTSCLYAGGTQNGPTPSGRSGRPGLRRVR